MNRKLRIMGSALLGRAFGIGVAVRHLLAANLNSESVARDCGSKTK
jgi:hypothetical protein